MPDRSAADVVREACDLLAGYLPRLARLLPDPDSPVTSAPGMNGRPPAAPLPGNVPALFAKTGIEASARQIEGILLYAVGASDPWGRRGGSTGNTLAALDAIPKLVAGAGDEYAVRVVIAELDRCVADAMSVPAIDEAVKWRPLRRMPGTALPPSCPYCGCFQLRVRLGRDGRPDGRLECWVPDCRDGHGRRPAAQVATDGHGRPVLAWADGRVEAAPELEAAG